MRYLLDTCIFIYLATDHGMLSHNVSNILMDPENQFCVSAETGRELIVGFNSNKYFAKYWDSSNDIILSIEKKYGIHILPIDKNVIKTYSTLLLNNQQNHKDPSDHIIISQAITTKIPLITSDKKFQHYINQGLELILN